MQAFSAISCEKIRPPHTCYNQLHTVILMMQKLWALMIPLLLLGAGLFLTHPVAADALTQVVYQTPTALPDGRVVYVVQEGDTCLRIQLLTGVTIEELRTLNRLDQECTIIPGRELLLAVITPQPTPTPNLNVTPTPLLPTPTPIIGNGQVCILLFNDVNGNTTREDSELPLAGGAVSITDRLGQISRTSTTSASVDPVCEEVPEGEYNISVAIPSGYNATTSLNLPSIKVQAGDLAIIEFGAQVSSAPQPTPAIEVVGSDDGIILAILGGLLILTGIGLGIYILVTRRGQ